MDVKEDNHEKPTRNHEQYPPLETPEKRRLGLLHSRLVPLARHPVYGSMLDTSDSHLLKWLAYCDNNAFLAEAKIRNCLAFRRKHKIDQLLENYTPPYFAQYYAGGLCGVDREGSPVYYELFGNLNLKDIMHAATKEQLIKFKIYQHEKILQHLKKLSKAIGKRIDTILVVVDMQSCRVDTFWNPALRMWAEIVEVLQDLYPGLVKEVLVINANYLYPEFYIALRPYINSSNLKLIKVLGQGFLKHLLHRIEKHEIPAYLGGYKCDYNNNPYCYADLNWDNNVPQFMMFTNKRLVAHISDWHIPGGGNKVDEYHVPIAKSFFNWDFYEISHPVLFSIYMDSIDEKNIMLAKTLISNKQCPRGPLTCTNPGRYFLQLDNCKNFARPAHVVFKVEVKVPRKIKTNLVPKVPIGQTINFRMAIGDREQKIREEVFEKYPHFRI